MSIFQNVDSSGNFSYELRYSHHSDGWQMNSISIQRRDHQIFSKKNLAGVYRAEAVLLEQGVNMCEAVITRFNLKPLLHA